MKKFTAVLVLCLTGAALVPFQTMAGGEPPPKTPAKKPCSLDMTPIKYQSAGTHEGISYVVIGDLKLAKGAKTPDGKRTIDFIEDTSFNFVTPVFAQLAESFSNTMNQAGAEHNNCQNSFGGASAWVSSNIPPRIEAKAGGTKRACTCSDAPCPTWEQPLRICNKCGIQDGPSGEVKKGWRVDAAVDGSGNGVQLLLVEEFSTTSTGGGDISQLLGDLGIIGLLDGAFNTNIKDQADKIAQAMSAVGNITALIKIPEPIRTKWNSAAWTAPTITNVQPYSLAINRSFGLIEGTACIVSKCIREYGVDGIRNGLCPDL